jgi:quercetin dioxygenase-like cupin family protein
MALIALAGPALAQHALPVVPGRRSGLERTPVIPGAHIAALVGDSTMPEIIVQRFKSPPNHRVAPHIHTYTEVVTVLSGTLGLGEGEKFDTRKGVI